MSVEARADRVVSIETGWRDGAIVTDLGSPAIVDQVMNQGKLVLLKRAFSEASIKAVRSAVAAWGRQTPVADTDDFRGNYHRRRAMVARLQQAPHVFHDYNFNDLSAAPPELLKPLVDLFEPLRRLYNDLTHNGVEFDRPETGPYVHPQIIHYPSGGGFFARHTHDLEPQKLGFIVSLSERGRDFPNGGTCFEIDGEVVEMEARQEAGDICVWRYDHPHWVTQSDLRDKFDWSSDAGRWVATFAYFDPFK